MHNAALFDLPWVDTHVHADAPEFAPDRDSVRTAARSAGVQHIVIPAVARAHWPAATALARAEGDSYALGIHPLFTPQADEADIAALRQQLLACCSDPHLVAVGEVGLDFFVPHLTQDRARERQHWFWQRQAELAYELGLPLILHVRRSSDALLHTLRTLRHKQLSAQKNQQHIAKSSQTTSSSPNLGKNSPMTCPGSRAAHSPPAPLLSRPAACLAGGIAHAFNGSAQQAAAFIDLGFKLGFGGALTFERAHKLRRLVCEVPLSAIVLETDAPDIPPQWLYTSAEQRAQGQLQGRNTSAELPRIAQCIARLRGISVEELAHASATNARAALRGLPAWEYHSQNSV